MMTRLYRELLKIRRAEEEVARAYPTDRIKSPVHLSIGQEAVSVGICWALNPDDIVYGTYRGHALYLARGGDLREMVAELYGKLTGCTRGKGGSMHLIAPERGVMGMSAVVGTTIANAVGHAYAMKVRRQEAIVASFFGDGATEEGVFAESLNFAALKKLPVLFVCENNGYAIHTAQAKRQGSLDLCAKASAFGVPGRSIDGSDIEAIISTARETVNEVRSGQGPRFLEVRTYRWREHVGPNTDFALGYRSEDECSSWIANDVLPRVAARLDQDERRAIEAEVEAEIADAFAFAEASPFPPASELVRDVYKEEAPCCN
ncbi:MAG: thiamine pyrophosphate-dependent dehydrogenase E1 component subunit alpha [Planctomycetia bacterium]|nr:thiamine pyrophosphate-dependent dehydrogenase E1 component subunit alpha [Planctomycetia bacterium]